MICDLNKRFWKNVIVQPQPDGFSICLDQRTLSTPAKAKLLVPTRALADEIAAEWDAQVEKIDPGTMPFTRMANAAIDKVRKQKTEVSELLLEYGDSDLLCYRAEFPTDPELALQQHRHESGVDERVGGPGRQLAHH